MELKDIYWKSSSGTDVITTENPFNGIESFQRPSLYPGYVPGVNPFNGIERSRVMACELSPHTLLGNPFNGIESAVQPCMVQGFLGLPESIQWN